MRTKFFYYTKAVMQFIYPTFFCRKEIKNLLENAKKRADYDYICERVSYYNKLDKTFSLQNDFSSIKRFFWHSKKWFSTYFCDCYEYIRYFPLNYQFSYLFGDINTVPRQPTIVKARPINDKNHNSIILKLNKYRHFYFLKDKIPFREKENKLIFYTALNSKRRLDFIHLYYSHPQCLCRCVKKSNNIPSEWLASRISIKNQLKYKFILSIEGNDVATSLKWIMSSNSIVIMPKPTCESWFMEGKLVANYHYIEIKDDFSDLIEKMNYYLQNPEKAEMIIKNANEFVAQFKDLKREKIISLLVLQKYFDMQADVPRVGVIQP